MFLKKISLPIQSFRKILKANMSTFVLLLLSLLVVLFKLSGQSFTIDELFSVFITKNLSELLNMLWNQEANMWIYYITLHYWRNLGTSEFVVRGLSVGYAIASIPLIYAIAKHLFNKKVATLSTSLLIINIFYVISAQTARSYSLMLLLTLASTYSFIRFNESRKYKIFYVLTSALSIYTHFYAGFVTLAQFLTTIFWKKLNSYYIAFVSLGMCLLPILLSPSFHSGQVDWIGKPTLVNLLGTAFILAGDFPPLFFTYGMIFIISLKKLARNIRNFEYHYLFLWLLVPICTAFLFSVFIKPIYLSVYLLTSLPPFLILSAALIENLSYSKLKAFFVTIILILSVFRLSFWYSQNTHYKWVFSNNDEEWRGAVNVLNTEAASEDAVVFYGYYNIAPYQYYSQGSTPQIIEISKGPYSLGGGTKLPEPNYKLLSSFDYKRVWLLLRKVDREILSRNQQLDQIQKELERNYIQSKLYDFPGVELVLYINNNKDSFASANK